MSREALPAIVVWFRTWLLETEDYAARLRHGIWVSIPEACIQRANGTAYTPREPVSAAWSLVDFDWEVSCITRGRRSNNEHDGKKSLSPQSIFGGQIPRGV